MNYEEKARGLIQQLGEVRDQIEGVRNLKDAAAVVPHAIRVVENTGLIEGMSGADKKRLAVAILNALIDLPFVPESVEGLVIGIAIDAVIAALNTFFGKAWFSKII